MFWQFRSRDRVFVSHSSAEIELARALVKRLEAGGLRCWLDDKESSPDGRDRIMPGQHYDVAVLEAMHRSSVMLLLVTRASARSEYVGLEVTTARLQRVPIVAVLFEDVSEAEMAEHLKLRDLRIKWLRLAPEKLESDTPRITEALRFHLHQERSRVRQQRCAAAVSAMLVIALSIFIFRGCQERLARGQSVPAAVDFLIRSENVSAAQGAPPKLRLDLLGYRLSDREWIGLQDEDSLVSGDAWAARLEVERGGWLYLFQQDAGGKVQWLFPKNETFAGSSGANPIPPNSVIDVPSGAGDGLVLDETSGRERVFAVVGAQRLLKLEGALARSAHETNSAPLTPRWEAQLIARKGSLGVASTGVERDISRSGGTALPHGIKISGQVIEARGGWAFEQRSFRHDPARK